MRSRPPHRTPDRQGNPSRPGGWGAHPGPLGRASRAGFGFWLIIVVLIILILALAGGVSHMQNRGLHREIVDAYLGRMATLIAGSAIEEAYWHLHHHMLTPQIDPTAILDWDAFLLDVPDPTEHPVQVIKPVVTLYEFQVSKTRPLDYNVEKIEDVQMRVVDREWDYTHGFWSGALEFETAVRLRIGAFPMGVVVNRRVRVRKRYVAAQDTATLSPVLRFLSEDICRQVLRD